METLLYGGLCALMVEFARHAPVEQRRQALKCAGVLCLVWVLFNLAWFRPLAPAHLLTVAGIRTAHEDMWLLADALAGASIMALAGERLWAWALWVLLFCQVILVSWCYSSGYQPDDYSIKLNVLFLAQVAVFGAIGGRGFVDRIRDYHDRFGLRLRAKASSAFRKVRL